jgi:polygalacturonase
MQGKLGHLGRRSNSQPLLWFALLIALTLLLAGSGFVGTAAAEPGAYSVLTYGAKGDGVTNDAAAIQNAVDAAAAAGGTVTFPAGTFVINSAIYLKSGISVVGTPGQTILTMPPKSAITFILVGTGLSNVTLDGLTFRASSGGDNVSGFYMVGARNCQARNLRFENLGYGMKLGGGPIGSGWIIEDIVARNTRTSIYASHIVDSTFARLDLQGVGVAGSNGDHCIYLETECHRLTFTDVVLTYGSGYALHLYISPTSGGSSSDILFTNLVADATNGRLAICIVRNFSNITLRNVTMTAITYGPIVSLGTVNGVLIEGFTAVGGSSLVGVIDGGVAASNITFKDGTYDGLTLPATHAQITSLVYDNVTLGSPTTTRAPVTTTTTLPPTTTTTRAPAATTTTLPPTTLPSTTITHASVTTTTTRAPVTTTTTLPSMTTTLPLSTTTTTTPPQSPAPSGEVVIWGSGHHLESG